jgi:hypothetical protein
MGWVIIWGDPPEEFHVVGLFRTSEEAFKYAVHNLKEEDWWIEPVTEKKED